MGLVMRDNPWGESIGFGDVVHGGVLGFSPSPQTEAPRVALRAKESTNTGRASRLHSTR